MIGDGCNDIAMFAQCPFSIAMGNASEEVKAKGAVCDCVKRGGRFRPRRQTVFAVARSGERMKVRPDTGYQIVPRFGEGYGALVLETRG